MLTVYKLTDENMQTHGGCQWVLGEWQRSDKLGPMCDEGGYHAYSGPLLAVLLNPIHADFSAPRLFRAEVDGDSADDLGLKSKHQHMRLVEELPLPVFSTEQRVYFGIICTKQVCKDEKWNRWADRWISGEDRTSESARAVRAAATVAARAREAWEAATVAAWEAARVAAAWAAVAARAAARAADRHIDLPALARQAHEWVDPLEVRA